ncbi:hypothetical protein JRO89_XS06G0128500 [Xanthoceras sorbifolium]|uniref:Uncharacterized protein n=1 Tax=Xanthoceras sorbifolium TaxID=99658 RepID=A0ABQ8HY04_9ROSI|nr:hypothetical protein JRO89_XS06G0128500 [Xanthoceras sorbifolium]
MMKINIKKSSTIQPAQDTPKEPLWTSNVDLLMVRVHTPRVFFYRPISTSSSNFFNAQELKESLSKALVLFYPLAGRLGHDENGRIEIKCNAEGALFVEADTDSALDDFNDFAPSSQLSHLLPKIDYSAEISSYPLLISQVTYFKGGGVVLGVGLHHILADGASTFNFVNTWASITRGVSPSMTPMHNQTLLRARVPSSPKFRHIEYDPSPSMSNINITSEPSISTAIFKITLEQLETLRTGLRKEEQTTMTKKHYSNYEVLAVHIWRCTCKARGLANDQETKLYMPVDGRSKLDPPLPHEYFGNAIFYATSIAMFGNLRSEPLMDTAERVHKAVKRMDDEYLRSAIDYVEETLTQQQPVGSLSLVRGRHTYKNPNLNVNKWSRFPVQDADFHGAC